MSGTEITDWRAEMRNLAVIDKGQETAPTGSFFSLRGGQLILNEQPQPNNEMVAIILDGIHENAFYPGEFSADAISAPKCFAFAREEQDLQPHPVVFAAGQEENSKCEGCPQNEFGTARTGKGKACGNRRRISVIPAGRVVQGVLEFDDAARMANSPVALMKLPVMSVRNYAAYLQQIANVFERPLCGVATLIKVVPDLRTQFKVNFSMLEQVPDHLMPVVLRRRKETQYVLEQPYRLGDADGAPDPAPLPRNVNQRNKMGGAAGRR